MLSTGSSKSFVLIGTFASAAIFVTDLISPLGITVGVAYVAVVLITLWINGLRVTLYSGLLATVLVILGFFLAHAGAHEQWIEVINRIFAAMAVWSAVYFVFKYKTSIAKELKNKERLDALFNYATEGMLIVNSNAEIVITNPECEKQFGYDRDELIGVKIETLIPERFTGRHVKQRDTYIHNPRPRPMGKGMELYGRKKDGTEFPVEISLSNFKTSEGTFVIGFIIDITERKKAEENIRKEKEIAQMYLDVAPILFVVFNKDHTIALINQTGCNVTGYEEDELIGKKWIDIMVREEDKASRQQLFEDLLSEKRIKLHNHENIIITKSGDERLISWNNTIIRDEKGTPVSILSAGEDITDKKKAEESIRKEQEMKKELEKEKELNEMKSRFVSMASHEFRTPLTTILSSASLISKYPTNEDNDKRLKHINRIKSSVQNLTEILNDFLSISKLEEGKIMSHPVEIELVPFVEEIITEMNSVVKKGQQIIYSHPNQDGVFIYQDKQLLKNVLINLTSNAIKYSDENDKIYLSHEINDSLLTLKIKDEGIGIPESDKEHLFERFFRADNSTNIQGTGLGLNIVKKYVELMQGNITFASELNKGTTFIVNLPI
jgi:PAS domain S-box-containing protein